MTYKTRRKMTEEQRAVMTARVSRLIRALDECKDDQFSKASDQRAYVLDELHRLRKQLNSGYKDVWVEKRERKYSAT